MNKSSFFIVGKHAVIEALKNPKRKVLRLFLTEESKKTVHRISPRKNLLKDQKIYFKTKKELDKYSKNEGIQHQGLIAEVEHLEQVDLKKFIQNKSNSTLVCLDEITDPRNIGSIIRSAASFSIDGIIIKERLYPSESKLMYKSASGAIENINIFNVSNINTTLKFLRDNNHRTVPQLYAGNIHLNEGADTAAFNKRHLEIALNMLVENVENDSGVEMFG